MQNKYDCVRGLTGFAVSPETSVSYKPPYIKLFGQDMDTTPCKCSEDSNSAPRN